MWTHQGQNLDPNTLEATLYEQYGEAGLDLVPAGFEAPIDSVPVACVGGPADEELG